MGKSTSGPDEIDVLSMMTAMQTLHSGRVELVVSLAGPGFSIGANTALRMYFDVLPGSSLPPIVEVSKPWPCADHRTLLAHLYAGLYQLDFEISKVYRQETLWGEVPAPATL